MKGFNRPYIKNRGKQFFPIYIPGENYSFYCNSDYPIDEITSDWRLQLIDYNGNFVYSFGIVGQVFISTTLYHLYFQNFICPYVPDGYYYLRVYDTVLDIEKMRTNAIQVWSGAMYETSYVKFRHNDQLFGVRYDLLPDFYQLFRLPINQIKPPEIRSERDQYRQSSNGRELRNSKSFRDIVLTLEMYWSSDNDMEALSAINEHSEVFINRNRLIQLTQIKVENPSPFSSLSKATFEAIVNEYNLDMTSYEYYGDFITWGGNRYDIIDTFFSS
jgi:hypothetical protein